MTFLARHIRPLRLAFLLLPSLPQVSAQQQYGSFFSVIYLNGAPVSPSQISCESMGQPLYCCSAGQSCAWDNIGQLACCPSGTTCSGNVAPAEGQYTEQVQQTQTIYRTATQNDCACVETTTTPVALPVVPVTRFITTSTSPTFQQTTTTTTAPVIGPAAVTDNGCPNGYSTVTEANVGTPTRVVGCFVIIDSGAGRVDGGLKGVLLLLSMAYILGTILAGILQ